MELHLWSFHLVTNIRAAGSVRLVSEHLLSWEGIDTFKFSKGGKLRKRGVVYCKQWHFDHCFLFFFDRISCWLY